MYVYIVCIWGDGSICCVFKRIMCENINPTQRLNTLKCYMRDSLICSISLLYIFFYIKT